jgi:single-stranded DNA-binding protein
VSINRVILSGTVGQYGAKIAWTEAGKPQTSFTLVCEEPSRGEAATTYKTFIPCLVVGPQAEPCAETLEAGDVVLLEGKLAWKAGKSKDAGRLHVVAFSAERLSAAVGASLHGASVHTGGD